MSASVAAGVGHFYAAGGPKARPARVAPVFAEFSRRAPPDFFPARRPGEFWRARRSREAPIFRHFREAPIFCHFREAPIFCHFANSCFAPEFEFLKFKFPNRPDMTTTTHGIYPVPNDQELQRRLRVYTDATLFATPLTEEAVRAGHLLCLRLKHGKPCGKPVTAGKGVFSQYGCGSGGHKQRQFQPCVSNRGEPIVTQLYGGEEYIPNPDNAVAAACEMSAKKRARSTTSSEPRKQPAQKRPRPTVAAAVEEELDEDDEDEDMEEEELDEDVEEYVPLDRFLHLENRYRKMAGRVEVMEQQLSKLMMANHVAVAMKRPLQSPFAAAAPAVADEEDIESDEEEDEDEEEDMEWAVPHPSMGHGKGGKSARIHRKTAAAVMKFVHEQLMEGDQEPEDIVAELRKPPFLRLHAEAVKFVEQAQQEVQVEEARRTGTVSPKDIMAN